MKSKKNNMKFICEIVRFLPEDDFEITLMSH